jgi:hypothetical protein
MTIQNNRKVVLIAILVFLTSCCTLSVNNVQTRGEAQDVVDSDPVNDIKPSTSLTIPAIGK